MDTVTQIEYEFQGGLVRTSVKKPPSKQKKINRALRGRISGFSAAARRRLMSMLNRLQWQGLRVAFCSLTYGQVWPDNETFKRHLDNFGKRLMRFAERENLNLSIVWKMEFQERGAPHLHLLIFGLPGDWNKSRLRWFIRWTWAQTVGHEYWDKSDENYWRIPFVQADWLNSKKRAMVYVSKYIAKVPAARSVFSEGGEGFNNGSYLTAPSFIGRFWGVIGRDNLPMAEIIRVVADMSQSAFHGFRRAVNQSLGKRWHNIPKNRRKARKYTAIHGRLNSFSIFVNDAYQWLDYLQFLILSG